MEYKSIFRKPITELEAYLSLYSPLKRNSPRQNSLGAFQYQLMELSKSPESLRHYTAGDPTKLINWRAYARTQELTIHQEALKAHERIGILVDLSSSMSWPDENFTKLTEINTTSKLYYSTLCALHLAYQHKKNEDLVDFFSTNEGQVKAFKSSEKNEFLHQFESLKKTKDAQKFFSLFKLSGMLSKKYERFYLFSDLFNQFIQLPSAKSTITFHTLHELETSQSWIKNKEIYLEKEKAKSKTSGYQILDKNYLKSEIETWTQKKKREHQRKNQRYFLLSNKTEIGAYLRTVGL